MLEGKEVGVLAGRLFVSYLSMVFLDWEGSARPKDHPQRYFLLKNPTKQNKTYKLSHNIIN